MIRLTFLSQVTIDPRIGTHDPASIRSVLYLQAAPGRRDELVEAFRQLGVTSRALTLDGCRSVEVHVPAEPDAPMLVTASWTGRDAYDEWLGHPLRAETDEPINALLAREPWGELYEVVIAEEKQA